MDFHHTARRALDPTHSATPSYAILVEGALQGIVIQRHFKALFVNQAYADIFGYTPEEILAMDSTLQLFALCEHTRLQAYRAARLQGGASPVNTPVKGCAKMARLSGSGWNIWSGWPIGRGN